MDLLIDEKGAFGFGFFSASVIYIADFVTVSEDYSVGTFPF